MELRKSQLLLFVGVLMASLVQIIHYYMHLPDLLYGGFMGIAIGVILFGVVRNVKSKIPIK